MAENNEIDPRAAKILEIAGKASIAGWLVNFNKLLTEPLLGLMKDTPFPGVVEWGQFLQNRVAKGQIDQSTADYLKTLQDEVPMIKWVAMLLIKVSLYVNEFKDAIQIFGTDRKYHAMAEAQPTPASADALIQAMILDPGRTSTNRETLKKYGYNDLQIDNMILSRYATVSEGTVRSLYLRGVYSVEQLYERLHELCYTDTRIHEIIQSWQTLPGMGDLVNMGASGALDPALSDALGLNDEMPADVGTWAEKIGVSKQWAARFWASHWTHPSIGEGVDMLHRGIIDKGDLNRIMSLANLPAYWKDKILTASYTILNRLDIRRMHDQGIMSDAEVVQAYQSIGYSPADALKMATLAISLTHQKTSDLTRSAILDSYYDDLVSREEAKAMLLEIKDSDDTAEFYLTMQDYKLYQDNVKIYITTFKDRFLNGLDIETDTRGSLNKLGLRGTKIDSLIDAWKTSLYTHQSLPSKAELDASLISGVITEGQWRAVMTRLGYTFEHQGWLLALNHRQIAVSKSMPAKSDLESWYKKGIITKEEYMTNMKLLGYSDLFIQNYIKEFNYATPKTTTK